MYIPRYVFHFVRTRDDCVWILFLEDTLVYECRACVGVCVCVLVCVFDIEVCDALNYYVPPITQFSSTEK